MLDKANAYVVFILTMDTERRYLECIFRPKGGDRYNWTPHAHKAMWMNYKLACEFQQACGFHTIITPASRA